MQCKQTGGSYEVRVSLAGVAEWVRSLGRLSPHEAFVKAKKYPKRDDEEISALSTEWLERSATSSGARAHADHSEGQPRQQRRMTALRQAAILRKTPVREGIIEGGVDGFWGAPMRLDADDPVWV